VASLAEDIRGPQGRNDRRRRDQVTSRVSLVWRRRATGRPLDMTGARFGTAVSADMPSAGRAIVAPPPMLLMIRDWIDVALE